MLADPITLLLAVLTLASAERHTARDVRLLPLARAQEWHPVCLGGTVTFTSPGGDYFYLQDDTGGVRVRWAASRNLRPGQYVTVHGTTTSGDVLTEVKAERVAGNFFHPFRPNRLPQPVPYTLTPDDAAYLDGRFVEVEVVVQRAWLFGEWIQFDLARGRGTAVGHVPSSANLNDAQKFA